MIAPGTIYTARVSYKGPGRYDCTRKSGSPFAPSWELLNGYLAKRKAGTLTDADWTEYSASYIGEMRKLWILQRHTWHGLSVFARNEGVVLVCYCTDSTHCHRTVLAELLVDAGERFGAIFTYKGEVPDFGAR